VGTDGGIVRIVVGVSGSPNSLAALSWAAREARLRAAEICVLHAWSSSMDKLAPYAPRRGVPSRDQEREASSTLLSAAIRYAVGSGVAGVIVRPALVEGSAIPTLLRYAASADLLVLGRKRRPGQPDSIALGAVARACILNSRCPVVFIAGADVVADANLCVGQWSLQQENDSAPAAALLCGLE
jgi:nucleotide-binding universal stress UspA family protein